MTREDFLKTIKTPGTFMFKTDKKEGLVSTGLEDAFIWVDERGFSDPSVDIGKGREPRNMGVYENTDEMLRLFRVDGELFAEAVLPQIQELSQILYS